MEWVFLWIVNIFVFYAVIAYAVKHGIDSSEIGKLIKRKYGVKDEVVKVSDDEIEKEIENEWDKN